MDRETGGRGDYYFGGVKTNASPSSWVLSSFLRDLKSCYWTPEMDFTIYSAPLFSDDDFTIWICSSEVSSVYGQVP